MILDCVKSRKVGSVYRSKEPFAYLDCGSSRLYALERAFVTVMAVREP